MYQKVGPRVDEVLISVAIRAAVLVGLDRVIVFGCTALHTVFTVSLFDFVFSI